MCVYNYIDYKPVGYTESYWNMYLNQAGSINYLVGYMLHCSDDVYGNPLYKNNIEVVEFELLTEFIVGTEVRRKFRMREQLVLNIEYAIYKDSERSDKRLSHKSTFVCRDQV